jgi:hypothetical protein
MRRIESREPGWWRAAGVLGMVIGAALWVAGIAVAWHFVGKYW